MVTSGVRGRLRPRPPALLRQVVFRRYWTGQSISYIGDQVTIVALPLVAVLAMDASAADMGFLAAAASLPNLLFAMHAGAWIDRFGRRRQLMIYADLARAVLIGSIPVAYWLDLLTLTQLYVVAFTAGSITVAFNLCANSLFTAIVPREDYVAGTSLTRGSYSFSWMAGPSLGGVLVQVLSAPLAVVVDAVSYLGSAALLGSIRPAEHPGQDKATAKVRDGLDFVRRTPVLLAKFAGGTALNFFYSIYFALLFLFAARELHLSSGLIGVAIGVGAGGALLGSAVTSRAVRRIGLGPAFIAGSLLYPAALLPVPLAGGAGERLAFVMLVVAEFGSGFGLMLCDISGNSIQQALTPDRCRSRVQGAHLALNYGVRPLGALAGGALGTWLGLQPALWVATVGGIMSVLLLLPSPIPQMRGIPEQAT